MQKDRLMQQDITDRRLRLASMLDDLEDRIQAIVKLLDDIDLVLQ